MRPKTVQSWLCPSKSWSPPEPRGAKRCLKSNQILKSPRHHAVRTCRKKNGGAATRKWIRQRPGRLRRPRLEAGWPASTARGPSSQPVRQHGPMAEATPHRSLLQSRQPPGPNASTSMASSPVEPPPPPRLELAVTPCTSTLSRRLVSSRPRADLAPSRRPPPRSEPPRVNLVSSRRQPPPTSRRHSAVTFFLKRRSEPPLHLASGAPSTRRGARGLHRRLLTSASRHSPSRSPTALLPHHGLPQAVPHHRSHAPKSPLLPLRRIAPAGASLSRRRLRLQAGPAYLVDEPSPL